MPRLKNLLSVSKNQLIHRSILWLNSSALLLLLALSVYASLTGKGRGIELLFIDPFSPQRPYAGFLTGISEVLWCLTVTICAFTFSLLKRLQRQPDWFILCSALGTGVLLVDDLFRLTLVLYHAAAVPQLLMYLLYGVGAIAYGLLFWRRILATPYVLLLISGSLFVFSSLVDLIHLESGGIAAMLEDGTKLLGLLNIALYFWQVCLGQLSNNYGKGYTNL